MLESLNRSPVALYRKRKHLVFPGYVEIVAATLLVLALCIADYLIATDQAEPDPAVVAASPEVSVSPQWLSGRAASPWVHR